MVKEFKIDIQINVKTILKLNISMILSYRIMVKGVHICILYINKCKNYFV